MVGDCEFVGEDCLLVLCFLLVGGEFGGVVYVFRFDV